MFSSSQFSAKPSRFTFFLAVLPKPDVYRLVDVLDYSIEQERGVRVQATGKKTFAIDRRNSSNDTKTIESTIQTRSNCQQSASIPRSCPSRSRLGMVSAPTSIRIVTFASRRLVSLELFDVLAPFSRCDGM